MKQTVIQQAIEIVRKRIDSMNDTLMGKHTAHHLQQVERDLWDLLNEEKEQMIEGDKIYKRISDLPQFMNPTETDKLMNIYLGQQAKSLFYMREVPIESIGVFQCVGGDWVYWFNNGFTYDTGVADSEAEALQIAKKNFKPYNYDII